MRIVYNRSHGKFAQRRMPSRSNTRLLPGGVSASPASAVPLGGLRERSCRGASRNNG